MREYIYIPDSNDTDGVWYVDDKDTVSAAPDTAEQENDELHVPARIIDFEQAQAIAREQQDAQEDLLVAQDIARNKRIQRLSILNLARDISYWGYVSSWFFLIAFLLGRIANIDIIVVAGVVGSLLAVSSSMCATEMVAHIKGGGRKTAGVIISAVAIALAAAGLFGIATQDMELITAGVLGLFAWSFVPGIIDFAKRQAREYRSYEYYENSNCVKNTDAPVPCIHYVPKSSRSHGSFSAINEVFGIPQPQDPPPIEISRDDIYDSDDWHSRIETDLSVPDDEIDNIIDSVKRKKDGDKEAQLLARALQNNDTLYIEDKTQDGESLPKHE